MTSHLNVMRYTHVSTSVEKLLRYFISASSDKLAQQLYLIYILIHQVFTSDKL